MWDVAEGGAVTVARGECRRGTSRGDWAVAVVRGKAVAEGCAVSVVHGECRRGTSRAGWGVAVVGGNTHVGSARRSLDEEEVM